MVVLAVILTLFSLIDEALLSLDHTSSNKTQIQDNVVTVDVASQEIILKKKKEMGVDRFSLILTT